MSRRHFVWLLLAGTAALVWWHGRPTGRAVAPEAGPIDWTADPVQTGTERPAFAIETRRGEATLTPRAEYDIHAVVEGTERYRFDGPAIVSPLDLILAWGEVPTPRYRDRLDYSQSWRFFFWRTPDLDLDGKYLGHHVANTHLIPANRNLRRALLSIDRGDEVRLVGLLVDVRAPDLVWPTSLTRADSGDGGCEILYVESARVGDRLYR